MAKLKKHTKRSKIHEVIYEADTPAGKLFDVVLLILIVLSIILVMLESVNSLQAKYGQLFTIAEWVITIFFTFEYIARVISIKKPFKYIFSFYGIIDLISTIPLYLAFFFTGTNALLTVRALRLLRVFRVLKVTRYISEADKLGVALRQSWTKISVFLFAVIIVCIISGTLMYIIEGEASGFKDIPTSIYWCIVTLTTVGYGDIAPVSALGQFLAALIMIMGYGIIAVPTGIVSAEYSRGTEDGTSKGNNATSSDNPFDLNTQSCVNCNHPYHKDDAKYCHQCGYALHYE